MPLGRSQAEFRQFPILSSIYLLLDTLLSLSFFSIPVMSDSINGRKTVKRLDRKEVSLKNAENDSTLEGRMSTEMPN